jgi:hypothetical protein
MLQQKASSSVGSSSTVRLLGTFRVQPWDKMIPPKPTFTNPHQHGHLNYAGTNLTRLEKDMRELGVMDFTAFDEADAARKKGILGPYATFKAFCKAHAYDAPETDTTQLDERVVREELIRYMLEHEVYSMYYRNMLQGIDLARLGRNNRALAKHIEKEKKNHDKKMRRETRMFWKAMGGKDPAMFFMATKKLHPNQHVPGLGNFGEVMRSTTPPRHLPLRVLNYSQTLEPNPKGTIMPQDTNALLEGNIYEFDLTDYERECFKEILGSRMKNDRDFNISCRDFATLYENKADCIRMLRKALKEAQKLAATFKPGQDSLSEEEVVLEEE